MEWVWGWGQAQLAKASRPSMSQQSTMHKFDPFIHSHLWTYILQAAFCKFFPFKTALDTQWNLIQFTALESFVKRSL